jgi:hypothetical protein
MGEVRGTQGREEGTHRVLVRIYEGNRPFGRPRYRWEDDIKIYLTSSGIAGYVWTGLLCSR